MTIAATLDRPAPQALSDRRHPLDGPPADAVVFVLVDALRHDYVGRTRFLRRIAAESVTGQLEEPFGFCPRGAYFGGLTMAAQGYTNLFRYDPVRSPFAWTRDLASADTGDARLAAALRPAIVARAKGRVPPFAAAYLDPLEIPLAWLGYFDVCEREGPASARVGYRSIFHELDATGQAWLDVSWPYPGWVGGLSSGRVAGQALDALTAQHRFAFVHLPDLDMIGHAAGPGSQALQAALDDTDRLCAMLAERLCALHHDPLILFAGDHGMLPVVRHVDVAGPLAATGVRFGDDAAYFIDSTMVRVWTHTSDAHARIRAALDGRGGHWLTPDDLARYELAPLDGRVADAIFLADPGVLFTPNFFDWRGARPAKGMHGYAPDVADNRAALIAWRPRRPRVADVGVVPARTIHPALRAWLGFDVAEAEWPAPIVAPVARGRWSVTGTAASDAVVDAQLAHVVTQVHARVPDATALVLAGGFGRGEGTVLAGDASTPPRPVNDYDLVVVGGTAAPLNGLDRTLAEDLGLDFVDLWPRPTLTPELPLSQFDFDLRYGATRLAGDPLVLDRLPLWAPDALALDEGLFQIGTRAAGLLLGLCGRHDGAIDDAPFRERQRVKCLIAVADAFLMAYADYHASYVVRRARFAALSTGVFGTTVRTLVDEAFRAKLEGVGDPVSAALAGRHAAAALDELATALDLDRDPARLAGALARTVTRRVRAGGDWLAAARLHGLRPSTDAEAAPLDAAAAIYRAAVDGLRAWPETHRIRQRRLADALAPAFSLTGPALTDAAAAVARTWITFFHA